MLIRGHSQIPSTLALGDSMQVLNNNKSSGQWWKYQIWVANLKELPIHFCQKCSWYFSKCCWKLKENQVLNNKQAALPSCEESSRSWSTSTCRSSKGLDLMRNSCRPSWASVTLRSSKWLTAYVCSGAQLSPSAMNSSMANISMIGFGEAIKWWKRCKFVVVGDSCCQRWCQCGVNISEGAENEDESPCKAQFGSRDAYGSRSKDRKTASLNV